MDVSSKASNTQDKIHRLYEAQEEGQEVWMLQSFLEGRTKTSQKEIWVAKYGAETEEKAIQTMSHLGILPIQTLLLMSRTA